MIKQTILLFLLLTFTTFAGDHIQGTVTKVIDGDTITVKTKKKEVKVRLYGIDAPEKKQDYGKKSTRLLKKLIDNETVQVVVTGKDKYHRKIGKIFFEGQYINLVMVQNGAAWWYKKYAKKDVEFKMAEKWAKESKIGLWEKKKPVAPWKWRKKHK